MPASRLVLIVEDEAEVIGLLARLMQRIGLTTATAHDYDEAMVRMAEREFGCALVDKNLPGRSGLEVIQELRKKQPYCGCVLMTGYPSYESMVQALRAGVVDYVEKPFNNLHELGMRISGVIDRQAAVFERDTFAAELKVLHQELWERDQRAGPADVATLKDYIDYQVAERTASIDRRCELLQARVRELEGQLARAAGEDEKTDRHELKV